MHDTDEHPLILVTDEAISILDQTDNMTMWMIFKRGTSSAYSDQFGLGVSFTPVSVSFLAGLLSVGLTPVPGAIFGGPIVLNIDFVNDRIYIDLSLPQVHG